MAISISQSSPQGEINSGSSNITFSWTPTGTWLLTGSSQKAYEVRYRKVTDASNVWTTTGWLYYTNTSHSISASAFMKNVRYIWQVRLRASPGTTFDSNKYEWTAWSGAKMFVLCRPKLTGSPVSSFKVKAPTGIALIRLTQAETNGLKVKVGTSINPAMIDLVDATAENKSTIKIKIGSSSSPMFWAQDWQSLPSLGLISPYNYSTGITYDSAGSYIAPTPP
jgi:hypothetical protein